MDSTHTVQILGLFIKDDTVFTVGITIGIFISGVLIKYFLNWFNEYKGLKEVKKLLYTFIELLEEPITKQVKSMNECSEALKKKRIENIFAEETVNLNTSRIRDLPSVDLYKALILKGRCEEKEELFAIIFKGLDFIDEIKKSLKINISDLKIYLEKYEDFYENNMQSIARWSDSQITSRELLSLTKDNFYMDFSRLYNKLVNHNDTADLNYCLNEFLIPLINIIKKYPGNSNALALVPFVHNAYSGINNYFHVCSTISQNISSDAVNLLKHYYESKIAVEKLLNKN